MRDASDPRLHHAHVARNRQPILDVLARALPLKALVLEIASGSGEHAAFFADLPNGVPKVTGRKTKVDRD